MDTEEDSEEESEEDEYDDVSSMEKKSYYDEVD